MSKPSAEEIQQEFGKQKRRDRRFLGFFIGIVSLWILVMEFLALEEHPALLVPGLIFIFVFVFASLLFKLGNWTCPACRSYLGRDWSPRFCKHCGAQLQ